MIKPRLIFLLIGLGAGLLWAAPTKPADESALIRQRIDALLKRRQKPEPLPADPPNPFSLTAVGTATPGSPRDNPPAAVAPEPPALAPAPPGEEADASNPTELLARFASRLRITGVIRLKDQVHIIINDSPWKEGDYLIVNQGARILRLQVARIQPGQLTLRLEEAELVLRF
jgi:hypothetical protein